MRNCSKGAISPLCHNIFNISLTSGVKIHIYLLNVVVRVIVFLNSANLIGRGTDISKCFREPLRLRDNESRLSLKINVSISRGYSMVNCFLPMFLLIRSGFNHIVFVVSLCSGFPSPLNHLLCDSRYLEVQGTLWNASRYPYLDISDLQKRGQK